MPYRHITIFRDRHRYVMGPCLAVCKNGDWLCSFAMSVMREVGAMSPLPFLHPPLDPEYRNYVTRSRDQGRTWSAPRVLPGYDWFGGDVPALCTLANGDILASHYRREFHSPEAAALMPDLRGVVRLPPYPWVASHGGTYVHRSVDQGKTWRESVQVNTHPYVSGYGRSPAVEMPDGALLLPLAAADPFFDIFYRESGLEGEPLGNEWDEHGRIVKGKSAAFVAISRDGGRTWNETRAIARMHEVNFREPALVRLASGRLICQLRTEHSEGGGYLFQVVSDDDGETWSEPKRTPLWGYPAHIVQLPDGRILSVYGHRRKPYGIKACVSDDDGASWDMEHELTIRDDLLIDRELMFPYNLGYPTALILDDGGVFTAYWGEDADGTTTIQGTYFRPPA